MDRLCLIGDGSSIHIRRWAGHFKSHGWSTIMVSLTRGAGEHPEYDQVREVHPKTGALGYSRTALSVRKLVKSLEPDIVHGHYLTSAGFHTSLCASPNKVVSAWGSDLYKDSGDFLKRQCIRHAINRSSVCLADSEHLANECRKLSPGADVRKVIFGIDTEKFKPEPIEHDKFRFLSIRATSEIYNPMVIVKAFEKADIDAELWMFKPSPDAFNVYDYVRSRPELDQKVTWLDRRTYDQMPELYNSVDVGISMPSWDSSSTAMLECMSCGIPTILADIPQNREWDGPGTFMAEPKSVESLRGVMVTLHEQFQDKNLYRLVGQKAREPIQEKADFDTEMSKAERIYQEVLDAKR